MSKITFEPVIESGLEALKKDCKQLIGGVIVSIDHLSNQNHLDFFFIDPENHSIDDEFFGFIKVMKTQKS